MFWDREFMAGRSFLKLWQRKIPCRAVFTFATFPRRSFSDKSHTLQNLKKSTLLKRLICKQVRYHLDVMLLSDKLPTLDPFRTPHSLTVHSNRVLCLSNAPCPIKVNQVNRYIVGCK